MAPHPRIGTTIRRGRERKRMRQQDLADALGVSRTTVDAWENDRAYPRNSIGALEDILGVKLEGEPAAAELAPWEAWEAWEAWVLTLRDLPTDLRYRLIEDARAARDADDAARRARRQRRAEAEAERQAADPYRTG